MKGMPIQVTIHRVFGFQPQLVGGGEALVVYKATAFTWSRPSMEEARRLLAKIAKSHLKTYNRFPETAAKVTLSNGKAHWFYMAEEAPHQRNRFRPVYRLREWTGPVIMDTAEPAEVA